MTSVVILMQVLWKRQTSNLSEMYENHKSAELFYFGHLAKSLK
jgi:hypothetical protein